MRYQELVINKLDILDGKLKTLLQLAQHGQDIQAYNNAVEEAHSLVEEIKSYIERES